jgi:alpha-ketoglutarate-dependent taurine dioxygenase
MTAPSNSPPPKPNFADLSALRRKKVTVGRDELVSQRVLDPSLRFPLVISPAMDGVEAAAWAADHREEVEREVHDRGAVLFRGFAVDGEGGFGRFTDQLTSARYEYTYRSTPRTELSKRIYTSTEYPADQHIPLHNEMSYTSRWPLTVWFYCAVPAEEGGETPVADSRRVYRSLDPAIRERFAERGVMYVRNYGQGLDLSWQEVFQTEDRGEAESFCRRSGIDFNWRDGDRLSTRQVCQGVARHPQTGDTVWFNQAHLFHVSSLDDSVRESMLAVFSEEELPRNAYYGDGKPLEDSVLAEIRAAFDEASAAFPWQKNDILMVDNMLLAHGRRPFRGSRKVLVAMAEPHESEWTP